MELTAPEPITADHVLGAFDSGRPALDSWLVSRPLRNERDGGVVARYYCLSAGSVTHGVAPGRIRRNMPNPVPVVLLGRLAVARSHQGKGIARALVQDAILRTRHSCLYLCKGRQASSHIRLALT